MAGTVTPVIAEDPELGTVKRCPRCREWWPLDAEFFYPVGDGFTRSCRACVREYQAEWYRRHAPKPNSYGPDVVCRAGAA